MGGREGCPSRPPPRSTFSPSATTSGPIPSPPITARLIGWLARTVVTSVCVGHRRIVTNPSAATADDLESADAVSVSPVSLQFELRPNPHPRSEAERQAILADPGFGVHFTDHMAVATWTAADGWHDSAIVPYGPFSLDPATAVLHYAQEIFEGLKAYQHADGSVWLFRPDQNAARMQPSAQRLALPELSTEDFLASIDALVAADAAWVPAGRAGPHRDHGRAEPLPAAVHVRLRGLPRGAGGQAGHLLLHRQPGRPVLRRPACARSTSGSPPPTPARRPAAPARPSAAATTPPA